ncbi:TrkH family potassium uptake protein [Streptococcus pantholopis]|uniref:ATPase V n=1 Tax=Streptococcus pantholopis TaxID=1811193 RepID=A0A172Q5I5_9STRE|nr:potassium transporter TrkG [Streptococcus pantholopis]AND78729.1 ATPase V [Streptococcus pantholopis]
MFPFNKFSAGSVTQKLTVSFLTVILVGSLLLSLPFSHSANAPTTTYFDHLFTTVSMVCVTGLSVFPISEVYNSLGQFIAMILMQIGGLGIVTLIAISMFVLHQRLGLSARSLLQSALSRPDNTDLQQYLFNVYKISLVIEGMTALILMFDFIPRFGVQSGIFNSLFLAVSAFCNAGFDNLGTSSLKDFMLNPLINFTVAFAIISGGLGFSVWFDLFQIFNDFVKEKPRRLKASFRLLSNQSRLILYTTAIFLSAGTLLSWLTELRNPNTLAGYNAFQQFMISFFQTVTMRTAGFSTLSFLDTEAATNFLYMLQMAVGGAPGGTAGGIKVTTAAIIFLLFKSELAGQSDVTFRHRVIHNKTIKQTLTILIFFFVLAASGYFLLLLSERHLSPTALLFEVISAIATVGVSMDVTPALSSVGRCIIILLMFTGRVGPITVLLSFLQKKEKAVHYTPTDISLG